MTSFCSGIRDKITYKKAFGEILGTLVLVFFGCGSVIFGAFVSANYLPVSLGFGLGFIAAFYLVCKISGCHINPAVSFAMLLNKRIKLFDFIIYVISQLIGAFLGALLIWGIHKTTSFSEPASYAANLFDNKHILAPIDWVGAFILEVFLTFIFVLIVLVVTSKKASAMGGSVGLIIGLTLALVHIIGVPLDGTSVNPARSFGPAMIELLNHRTYAASCLWLFISAPLVGALLSSLVSTYLFKTEQEPATITSQIKK